MRFLKTLAQDLAISKQSDDEPPIHSFFITEEEYGDDRNNYVQISEKMITVYDKTLKDFNLRAEGLSIRNAVDVNQSYMYTISDQIKQTYQVYQKDA